MNSLELLRRYLHRLNDKEAPHLQFVWVLDLDGVSVRHINWVSRHYDISETMLAETRLISKALSEIAAWYFKDIGPHYPYLCGAGRRYFLEVRRDRSDLHSVQCM